MAVYLSELAEVLAASRLHGSGTTPISGIQTDHRKVRQGDLFVCISGHVHDGHVFSVQAAAQGATALVVEKEVEAPLPKLIVKDSRQAMGVIATHFYRYPSRELRLIGVTGTNGKTTTTFMLDHILDAQGFKTGLMGTIYTKIGGVTFSADRTTQEAVDLQRTLRKMADEGIAYCTIEVSSHALELGRVKGCRFRTAIFTNLTQDHLDYHLTMDRYREAKGLLFARLGNDYGTGWHDQPYAVLNADDPASQLYARLTAAQTITYGIDQPADVSARNIRITARGTEFDLTTFAGDGKVHMKLIGKFNVYNALGVIAAALLERIPLQRIVSALATCQPIAGRMESVDQGQDYLVLVDYAHTPDGLDNALRTISEFAGRRVITVFGCGGDRDRTKRPMMGRIAAEYSDVVIVTSDNPRTEDPQRIIDDIAEGIRASGYPEDRYECIADREAAIHRAIALAGRGDVVLIAGKGHETYQILHDRTIPFDDRNVAAETIRSAKR